MPNAFQALAEPRRQQILRAIATRELTAGAVAGEFEITRQAVSQHLQVLRDAGLVRVRRDGTKRYYSARPEGLAEAREFLDGLWTTGLERLKRTAEHEQTTEEVKRAAARN